MFALIGAALMLMTPPTPSLNGSRSSQLWQNYMVEKLELPRINDRAELEHRVQNRELLRVVPTDSYELDVDLGSADRDNQALYAHAQSWVVAFLNRELGAAYKATGARFRITSLVRTKEYQRRLMRGNINAVRGDTWWAQSSHLTGATVDISWKNLDPRAADWLKRRLLELERAGLVEASRERLNACFHVMVFPKYLHATRP